MFNVYVRDFNRDGQLVTSWELLQSVPALSKGDLRLISPVVKNDMGNAESLDFGIEPGTKYYDAFLQMKTFIRIDYGENTLDTIFYGRVLTITNSFYGSRKIRCEGPLAFFNDTAVEGVPETSRRDMSINDYLIQLINNHNNIALDDKRQFTLGEVPGNYTDVVSEAQRITGTNRKYGSDSWTDTKSALEDLRSHHGGYYRVRPIFNGNFTSLYLDWMDHYFNKDYNTQAIEVGKNVLDISISTEIDNIFTVVIPIGTKTVSTSSEDGVKKAGNNKFYVDSKEIKVPDIVSYFVGKGQENKLFRGYHTRNDYEDSINKYGRIIKTVTFDDAKDENDLYDKCCEWILNNYQGEVTKFQIKAVDMHQIGENAQKILVGDRVRIIYPAGTENGNVIKQDLYRTCLSISYDLYNPENNTYTFGIPANILTKTYGVTKQGKSTTGGSKPKGGDTSSKSQEQEWFDWVTEWLRSHMIWYKTAHPEAPYPYSGSSCDKWMDGPFSNVNKNWIYSTDNDYTAALGQFTLWHPKRSGETMRPDYDPDEYQRLLDADPTGYGARQYKDYYTISSWNIGTSPEGLGHTLTLDDVIRCNLIEYVKDEYGINLKTQGPVKMPSTITLADGSKVSYKEETDPETGESDMIATRIEDPSSNARTEISPDGRTLIAYQDEEGNWLYATKDVDGNYVLTNFYSFSMDTIENNRQHAFITTKYFNIPKRDAQGHIIPGEYEEDPEHPGHPLLEAYDYEFGQTVENYAKGELVVARVDGDVVRLGGAHTTQVTTKALENISNVCGDFTVEVDIYGQEKLVVKEGSAIYQKKDGIDVGYYHDGNLTGGIMVTKINNQGETVTRIVGDKIVIGQRRDGSISKDITIMATDSSTIGLFNVDANGNAVMEAGTKIYRTKDGVTAAYGIWDSSGQEVQGGLVVEKINNQTTTYVRGDRIVVGNAQTNKSVMEALKTAKVITSDTLEPQALVTSAVYTLKINSLEGRIGTLETDYLKTVYLTSEESALSKIYFKELWGNSIRSSTISSTNIYLRRGLTPYGSDDNWSIKNFIAYVQVVPSGDDFKLQYKDFDDEDWQDAGTFNRAATIQGAWSGGTYTVTPKIGKIKENISTRINGIYSLAKRIDDDTQDNTPRKHNVYPKMIGQDQKVTYYAPVSGGSGEQYIDTGYHQTVWINAEEIYDDGRAAIGITGPVWNGTTGSGATASNNARYSTTGKAKNDNIYTYYTVTGHASWSNNKATIKVRKGSSATEAAKTENDNNVFLKVEADATSVYNAGKAAATVTGPTFATTGTSAGSSNSISVSKNGSVANTIYTKMYVDTSTKTAKLRYGSSSSAAESGSGTTLAGSVDCTAIWNAGKAAATVSGPTFATTGTSAGSSNSISVSKDGSVANTIYTKMYVDTSTKTAKLRYGSTAAAAESGSGTTIAGSVDCTAMWTAGWQAYYDKSAWWQKPEGANGWVCKIPNRAGTGSEQWFKFSTSVSSGVAWWTSTTSEDTARTAGALAMGCAKTDISIIYAKSSGATADTWAFFKVGSSPYMIGF